MFCFVLFFFCFCILVLLGHTFFIFVCFPDSGCKYTYDPKPFIFSLVNKPGWAPVKLSPPGGYQGSSSNSYAIASCPSNGPSFGLGHDLHIANQAASNTRSFTNLGNSYGAPSGHTYASTFTRTFLAGSYHFQPDEVEVFYETN